MCPIHSSYINTKTVTVIVRVPKQNPRAENPKQRLRKGFNSILLIRIRITFTMALDLRIDKRGM